jgi:hypothetical protein
MPYTIQYNAEDKIIEGVFSGEVNTSVLRQYSNEAEKVYKATQCKLNLSDYREATFSFSVVDLYRLPQKHSDLLDSVGLNIHTLKRAAIFNKKYTDLATFFENVAVNRGQKFKVFSDKELAIEWLKAESDNNPTF